MEDLRKHLINKFFSPKTFIFDRPGVILNKNISRFGRGTIFTRVVFFFGDLLVDLYNETFSLIGQKRTNELWYKIGRDIGLRYISFSGRKYFPKLIRLKVVERSFNALKGSGLGHFELIKSKDFLNFVVECKDSFFMKKMKGSSFFEGLFSGLFSGIFSKNFFCESYFSEKGQIRFNLFFDSGQEIFFEEVCCHSNYFSKNKYQRQNLCEKNCSLKDFFKFNKIVLDKEFNFWKIGDYPVFPSEVGLFGLIFKNYFEKGFDEIFKKIYVKSSEKIFLNLLQGMSHFEKIRYFKNFISALGWGIVNLRASDDKIKLNFLSLPFSRYGVLDKAYFFNGLLNAVFRKKFFLLKNSESEFIYGLERMDKID